MAVLTTLESPGLDFKRRLKVDLFPTIWCPGCGIGTIMIQISKPTGRLTWATSMRPMAWNTAGADSPKATPTPNPQGQGAPTPPPRPQTPQEKEDQRLDKMNLWR